MRLLLSTACVALTASSVLAQTRTVDEGTFIVTQSGAPVGREVFRIVQTPSGSGGLFRATAQISTGDQRVLPSLSTDSTGIPIEYVVGIRSGANRVLDLEARARPSRFAVVEQTPGGQTAKEYVVPKRLVVLDDRVYHQYFFVTLAGAAGTLAVIDPRGHTQTISALERMGSESVEVAGRSVSATRYALVTGGTRREFWLDEQGRVLKVALPGKSIQALREELPR